MDECDLPRVADSPEDHRRRRLERLLSSVERVCLFEDEGDDPGIAPAGGVKVACVGLDAADGVTQLS